MQASKRLLIDWRTLSKIPELLLRIGVQGSETHSLRLRTKLTLTPPHPPALVISRSCILKITVKD
ncbi:hypothetical protein J6590_069097 [Homalodisca vitripennis]|nr:hypothetical protein J6590_069097 [Homalodisca vitripennis]